MFPAKGKKAELNGGGKMWMPRMLTIHKSEFCLNWHWVKNLEDIVVLVGTLSILKLSAFLYKYNNNSNWLYHLTLFTDLLDKSKTEGLEKANVFLAS